MTSYCKGCTIARTFQAEHKRAFHPDLERLGYSAFAGDSVRDVLRRLTSAADELGIGAKWRANRETRHNLLAQALGMHAHNLACYISVSSGFSRESAAAVVRAFPHACGDWITDTAPPDELPQG